MLDPPALPERLICQPIHPHILDGRPLDRTKCPISKVDTSGVNNAKQVPCENQTSHPAPLNSTVATFVDCESATEAIVVTHLKEHRAVVWALE